MANLTRSEFRNTLARLVRRRALARDLALPLVTADGALLRAFPAIAIAPNAFATK